MKENNKIQETPWNLLAKHFANETNSKETELLNSWKNSLTENQIEFEKTEQVIKKLKPYFEAKRFNTTPAWENVQKQISHSENTSIQHKTIRKEVFRQFYKYAAILILVLLLGSVSYFAINTNFRKTVLSEIITAKNQVNEFELPDGSWVTLNGNSKLLYPKKFKNNIREITLVGEAFFDVQPNPENPFIINAGNTQVKVLGTSFNISAYPENEKVEVVVKTGKVQLIELNHQNTALNHVFLAPGEKGTFFYENKKLEKVLNNNPNYLAWKTHDLIFNETPLKEVVACLEKAYHVSIMLENDSLKSQLYTAHFDKKPIDFVLNVIQMSFNLEMSMDNEQITLSSRKSNM